MGVIGAVAAIVMVLVVVLFLPLLAFLAELALLPLAAVLLLPWTVEARTTGPPQQSAEWPVRGFVRSRKAVDEVAEELARGVPAAPEELEPVMPRRS